MLELFFFLWLVQGFFMIRNAVKVHEKLDKLRDIQFRQVLQDNEVRQRLIWMDSGVSTYFSLNITEQNEISKAHRPEGVASLLEDPFLNRHDPPLRIPHGWKKRGAAIPNTLHYHHVPDRERS